MTLRGDLKEMVHSKWSKVEKAMNKVLNDVHKWRRHKSMPIARRSATEEATPSPSPRPPAASYDGAHHHHHTIISVDLENLNSHHTNVQNVHPVDRHAVPKPPAFAGYGNKANNTEKVKMIKSTAAHRNKRRVRSVSLDPAQMDHSISGKRNAAFRSRPSSHGGRS